MPIQFSCKCGKRLQVKNELAGRRVRCPGCQQPVAIPAATQPAPGRKPKESVTARPPARGRRAAAPPDNRVQKDAPVRRRKRPAPPAAIDDEEEEDEYEEEERPRRKKKGKKGKKSKSRSNLPLLLGIGGGSALLLIVGGILLYLFVFTTDTGPISQSGNNVGGGGNGANNNGNGGLGNGGLGNGGLGNVAAEDHLDKIPAHADFMATLDIQGLKAKLPQQLVSSILSKANPADFEEKIGIPASAIARTTVYGTAAMVVDPRNNQPVFLLTSLKPLDSAKIQKQGVSPPDSDGLILVREFPKQYVVLLTNHTLAVGPRHELIALKQGQSQTNAACAKGVAMARSGEQLVIAGRVPQGMVENFLQKVPPQQRPQLNFLKAVQDFSGSAKLDGSLMIKENVSFSNPGAANEAKIQSDFWLNVVKNQLKRPPPFRNEMQKQIFNMAAPILNQIQVQQNGGQLNTTVTIPKTQVDSAIKLLEEQIAKMPDAEQQMTENNLRQIGIAMHTHHDQYGSLPQPSFNKGLSWRVKLLPYLEQENLYKQFNLNEPWDSPHNRQLLEKMPKVFERSGVDAKPGYTHFQVSVGPGGLFPTPNAKVMLQRITDGTSNTIMVVEAKQAVPWTAPQDLTAANPQFGADSQSANFAALFCDGSVHLLENSTPMQTLRAYLTPNGGEPVAP